MTCPREVLRWVSVSHGPSTVGSPWPCADTALQTGNEECKPFLPGGCWRSTCRTLLVMTGPTGSSDPSQSHA